MVTVVWPPETADDLLTQQSHSWASGQEKCTHPQNPSCGVLCTGSPGACQQRVSVGCVPCGAELRP